MIKILAQQTGPNELQAGSLCHTAIKRSVWPFFAWPVMRLFRGRVWKENTSLLIPRETFHYDQKLLELVSGFF